MMADNQVIDIGSKRTNRSSSIPAVTSQKPRQYRHSVDQGMATGQDERLADGRILVLKVIGKINLRIERKDYDNLSSIFEQVPGDVLVLILGKLSLDGLYHDIPSSLAPLASLFTKLQADCGERFPKKVLSGDDFVHHLLRYFSELLKFNNETFASARSREHIRKILSICVKNDEKLGESLLYRVQRLTRTIKDFTQHTLVELVSRSATKYCMKLHEALKIEMERATAHYKMALSQMTEVLQTIPEHNLDVAPLTESKDDEKSAQQIRQLTQKLIEERLCFNEAMFDAANKGGKGQSSVASLVGRLESRVQHDKEVLQIVSEVKKEFGLSSSDESVVCILERFQQAYQQVYQLLQESVKGTNQLLVPKQHLNTKDIGNDDPASDTDLFDSVTQLDEETDLERVSSTLSSTDSEKIHRENKKVKQRNHTKGQNNELEKVKKELQQAQERIKEMEMKEKVLRDRLADQAQRQLRRGGKYDDLSEVDSRPSTLTECYDNLYCQTRIDALDDLDNIQAFDKLEDGDSIKAKLLFSVVAVSYRTVYRSLTEKQHRIKRLLDISGTSASRHAQSVLDDINVYFRHTASHFNIAAIKREVSAQLWKTLYDFPELQKCEKLKVFINESVTLAWRMSVQTPPLVVYYETSKYNDSMHTRFLTSNPNSLKIQYHIWPTLIDSQTGHVFYRGVVVT